MLLGATLITQFSFTNTLIILACIGFFEELKAENALDALKNTLAIESKCWRNGSLIQIHAAELVPGDIIALRLGDIVPADCRLLGTIPYKLNIPRDWCYRATNSFRFTN